MTTPYIGFGNDMLAGCANAETGDRITCPQCGQKHKLESGTDPATGMKSSILLFYQCGDKSYLAAVAGELIVNQKADVSGTI